MISHDRWLLDRVATHILAFEDDGTQVTAALLLIVKQHQCAWACFRQQRDSEVPCLSVNHSHMTHRNTSNNGKCYVAKA